MAKTGNATKRTQPPRGKRGTQDKGAGPSQSRAEVSPSRAPWPRADGTPFVNRDTPAIPDITAAKMQKRPDFIARQRGDTWANFNSWCYNGLLRIDMVPTKFVCMQTLDRLGISGDVLEILHNMGMDTFTTTQYPLYPELVRQFLASVEVHYLNPLYPEPNEGRLTYLSSGRLYEISISELCRVYGFDYTKTRCAFHPEWFKQLDRLWHTIGSGECTSRMMKLTKIRNPVMRLVAKIIGHTLFAKEETGSLRNAELLLLHHGLPAFAHSIYTVDPDPYDKNLGAVFANMLVQKKFRGLGNKRPKTESVGSLLTLIFRYHGINLTHTACIDKIEFIDAEYLKNSRFFTTAGYYKYIDRDGEAHYCTLPYPDRTSITSIENIEFLPAAGILPMRATSTERGSTSRAHSDHRPSAHHEDAARHDAARHSREDPMEHIIPPYTGEYALPPSPTDNSDEAHRRWQRESSRNMYSMLERIWGALAKIQCPRPPSCFRGSDPSTREDVPRATTGATGPDVARHGTTSDSESTHDTSQLRRRSRRASGQSRSASPDHHHRTT